MNPSENQTQPKFGDEPEDVHVAWADYRSSRLDFLTGNPLHHAHQAFKAGFEAGRGKSYEEDMR